MVDFANRDQSVSVLYREQRVYDSSGRANFLPPLITDDFNTFMNLSTQLKSDMDVMFQPVSQTQSLSHAEALLSIDLSHL